MFAAATTGPPPKVGGGLPAHASAGTPSGYAPAVRPTVNLFASVALAGLSACSSASDKQALTVFAAASLAAPFRAIEQAYEREHPEHDVVLNFAGSQLLAAQLLAGAPALVFASADAVQLDRVAAGLELEDRRVFASNRIVIAIPAGSTITALDDLAAPGLRVVLAGEAVPLGRYARVALARGSGAGAVERNVISHETDARAVVAKLRLGEADAGLVYATDLRGDPQLELRELPPAAAVAAHYELARISEGTSEAQHQHQAAAQFIEFVSSPAGQGILAAHGFGPP